MKEQIILTGSCYWCLEAIFKRVRGVLEVESGIYHIDDYEFAFTKNDKLEAIRVTYEPNLISLENLYNIFYLSHIPTLVKWDKNDCFYPMCRSAVFFFNEEQKIALQAKLKQFEIDKIYEDEVLTKYAPVIAGNFFLVEEKYQDYYEKNPKDGYCTSIIDPKIEKLKTLFKSQYNNFIYSEKPKVVNNKEDNAENVE